MKSVILNMMIMGAIGCLIGEDATAEKYDYTNAWIQASKQKSSNDSNTAKKQNLSKTISSSNEEPFWLKSMRNTSESERLLSTSRRDSAVNLSDSTNNSSGVNIPPPPPLPQSGIGVPPPPPGTTGALTTTAIDSAEFTNEIKNCLQTFIENNEIGLFRKIINIYLRANKLKISEAISEGEKNAKKLVARVDTCSTNLREYSSSLNTSKENTAKKELCSSLLNSLKSLTTHIKKLSLKEYRKESCRIKSFSICKNMIEGVFGEYLEKCKKTVNLWRNDPILTILQEIQAIMTSAIVLADSCYDLTKLSMQESVPVSEIQMKNMVAIFKLRDLVLKKLDTLEKAKKEMEQMNSVIFLPTGRGISELDCLNLVLDYVEGIFKGEENNLQKLLDLKYLLNDKGTVFETNVNSAYDPLGNVRNLNDDILNVESIFKQAINDFETSSYSQFTNLFKSSGSNCNGGGLSLPAIEFTKSANLPILKSDDLKNIRLNLGSRRIEGDIISEYMKLLPLLYSDLEGFLRKYAIGDSDTNSIINRSKEKFFPSTFKKVENRKVSNQQEKKSLLGFGIKKGDEFIERDLDNTENILLSSTIKTLKSEVDKLLELEQDIKRTSEVIEKTHSIFEGKGGDSIGYIDRCLNRYLKFNLSFEAKSGRIMVVLPIQKSKEETQTRKLTSDYIPNLLYAFAQNRDLVAKSNMFMFSASKDLEGDKKSILNIIADFADRLYDVIEAMQTQNKNGELNALIEKVQKLRYSIKGKPSFKSTANKVKNAVQFTNQKKQNINAY